MSKSQFAQARRFIYSFTSADVYHYDGNLGTDASIVQSFDDATN